MEPSVRRPWVRPVLMFSAGALAFASLGAFLHAIADGAPAVREALFPRGVDVDPWAVAWWGVLAGLLILVGLGRRSAFSWSGVALLGVVGAFFFEDLGWVYLGVALLFAVGLGVLRPRRRARRHGTP